MTQVHCIISNKDFVAEGDLAYIEQLYKGSQIKILDKKWLDVGAVELILDRFPQEYIDDGYLSLQLDINFIDAEHHNMDKKVLLADMDSTIINVESIDKLATNGTAHLSTNGDRYCGHTRACVHMCAPVRACTSMSGVFFCCRVR